MNSFEFEKKLKYENSKPNDDKKIITNPALPVLELLWL